MFTATAGLCAWERKLRVSTGFGTGGSLWNWASILSEVSKLRLVFSYSVTKIAAVKKKKNIAFELETLVDMERCRHFYLPYNFLSLAQNTCIQKEFEI